MGGLRKIAELFKGLQGDPGPAICGRIGNTSLSTTRGGFGKAAGKTHPPGPREGGDPISGGGRGIGSAAALASDRGRWNKGPVEQGGIVEE